MSEKGVGEDKGESKDCVINDLHLPECFYLKCWTGNPRRFSNWPGGKNTSARASNAAAIYHLPVGKYTTGTSVWNTLPDEYECAYTRRGLTDRTTSLHRGFK